MANTVSNVSAGKPNASGSIYWGALGEGLTIPTDASTALDSDFVCLGYASDDGVKNELSTEDTVKAWGGDVVLTTKEDKFTFKLIEVINVDVLKAVFGSGNVSGTMAAGATLSVNDQTQAAACWVIEMLLSKTTAKRIVIPKGTIEEIGDIEYKDDEPVGYEITIACGEDANGNTHYEYFKTAS